MTNESDQLAIVLRLKAQTEALQSENSSLKRGGGGGTLPPVDIIDAKIAASEARSDTKFAKLEGKLDLIVSVLDTVRAQNLDARSEARSTRRTVIATGVSLAALLIAIFSLYVNSFSLGAKVGELAQFKTRDALARPGSPAGRDSVAVPVVGPKASADSPTANDMMANAN